MWSKVPILEIELTRPLGANPEGVADSRSAHALLTWRGSPVGWQDIPIAGNGLETDGLSERVLDGHLKMITRIALADALMAGLPPSLDIIDAGPAATPDGFSQLPSLSVVICTRERPNDLRRCLTALQRAIPRPFEIITVDNAPTSGETQLVAKEFPEFRYVLEPRPGLDWARNRGLLEAKGAIVAFVDDDVVVSERWAGMLMQAFARNPAAAAVTGLIAAYELETESQAHFELHSGFGRGLVPFWVHHPIGGGMPWQALATGSLGSGANMAFRREVFDRIGLFLPQLDCGTRTEGGGDLEILYRTLKHGFPIAYEPRAMVWHRHRREHAELAAQIGSWGIASFAMLECVRTYFEDETDNTRRYGRVHRRKLLKRLVGQHLRPPRVPRDLRLTEFQGTFIGKQRYYEALERALRIEREFGPQAGAPRPFELPPVPRVGQHFDRSKVAVRSVDLAHGAENVDSISGYWTTRVFLNVAGRALGEIDIENRGLPISAERLVNEMLMRRDAVDWVRLSSDVSREAALTSLRMRIKQRLLPTNAVLSSSEGRRQRASIVLATRDRPQELRRCLTSLTALQLPKDTEVLVIDNRPESPATAEVVKEFPSVVLIREERQGLSYARNAGFVRASGDILVCTDDDVVFAPDWLDRLLQPFRRNDIDIVCGNVLPMALDSDSQRHFEQYGGLGRGYEAFEVDQDWFFKRWSAVPTWMLGATANTAFRATLLRDPDVGLFEETLGPGLPSGVGEDTYLFYSALRNGYRLRYEPSSVVWHEHRKTQRELKRQLGAYGRGHVAYHLHTLFSDGDARALLRLGQVAKWQTTNATRALLATVSPRFGGATLPLDLVLTEAWGNLMGPLSLWQSRRIVRKRGRSEPMPPASEASKRSETG
jgi:GT2 family glycosyltransferase